MSKKTKLKFNLRVLMALKGIKTLAQVADGSGVSRPAITRIDSNTVKRIDINTLEKLCDYFECEVGDILIKSK